MKRGKVFLVGAGPGDPGLITVKGLQCISSADVVVFDRLVDRRLLEHASPMAELVDVGKVPGEGGARQAKINELLVANAAEGKMVVRLKGGDPFVFGRGGEEAEVLHTADLPFEVIPGVTSAIAAPAYAGIPLTHRGVASSFTVVTGSESPDKSSSSVSWESLAKLDGTLVVLMGWENLAKIVEVLVCSGRPIETPIALVQWGTEPMQKTVVGTLSDIVSNAEDSGLAPPVVAVIGEVVRLRERLGWFERYTLFGKRILVTRTCTQASILSKLLFQRGAEAIEVPTIEIQSLENYNELDDAIRGLQQYDWVVFTSANAVQAIFDRLYALGLDTRSFGKVNVGAIGSTTTAGLRQHGIKADYVPGTFTSDGIIEGLKDRRFEGKRVLLPRADIAPNALPNGLRASGADVHEVFAYRTVTPDDAGERLNEALSQRIDVATFTSSSTVINLARLLDGNLDALSRAAVACIGPITAATAREVGLSVDIVAGEHTITGLVDALEAHFT